MEKHVSRKSASKAVRFLLAAFMTICILTSTVVSLAVVPAKAIDNADINTITVSTVHAMLGDSLDYYVNGTTLDTMSYRTESWVANQVDAVAGYAQSNVLVYTDTKPSGGNGYKIPMNLHFQNAYYIEFYVYGCMANSNYENGLISLDTARANCTIQVGDTVSDIVEVLPRMTNSSLPAYCDLDGDPAVYMYVKIENPTPSDIYIGDFDCSYLTNSGSGRWWFGISAININTGYTYVGRDAPPAAPVTTTSPIGDSGMSGGGSGHISTDASGNTNFDFHITQILPDYIYQGSYSVSSENMPQTISSAVSALDTYGTSAVAAVSEFASDVNASGLLGQMSNFLTPKLIVCIMGINALCIVGWILTRYGGGV